MHDFVHISPNANKNVFHGKFFGAVPKLRVLSDLRQKGISWRRNKKDTPFLPKSTRFPNSIKTLHFILPQFPCRTYSLKKEFSDTEICQLMQIHGTFANIHVLLHFYFIYFHRQLVPSYDHMLIHLSFPRISTWSFFLFNKLSKPSCTR